jgi:PAS domain S-box-containing protein
MESSADEHRGLSRPGDTRAEVFRSGEALFAFDEELRVVSWNREAEELTGLTAEDAIGSWCWEVLGGTEEDGALVCHPRCSYARLAREGWPVRCHDLVIRTDAGRKRVALSTIALGNSEPRLFLHLMHEAPGSATEGTGPASLDLTPRQLQVLELLSDGLPAKTIARQLGIAVATVRNHVRAILIELDAHSQLEALAKARREGLLHTRG